MPDLRHVRTRRLDLRAVAAAAAEDLFPLLSDPALWTYDPSARHVDITQTRAYAALAGSRWHDGLSYWTVRLQEGGAVVGSGGAQLHGGSHWNLNYRIATAAQGHGYATELARAALKAAHEVDPAIPVIAWIDESNVPSRQVAERVGLVSRGLRHQPTDGRLRLAYADRELPDAR